MKILVSISDKRYQTLIEMKDSGVALSYCEEAIVSGTAVPDNCEVQPKVSDVHANIPYCKDAISKTIVETLETLLAECGDMGHFRVDDNDYQLTQLITELKAGTEVGRKFQKNVCDLIATYLMKFGGEECADCTQKVVRDVVTVEKPVKWIEHFNEDEYECGRCHEWSDCQFDYCPNCGAKMEVEK